MQPKLYILGTLEITAEIIDLLHKKIKIDGVFGLKKIDNNEKIASYYYLREFCKNKNIDFIELESYSIVKEEDKKKILERDIDVLIVFGWQRLVPREVIDHCKIGAFGFHGSPYGIEKGRGRSPQNWALILGENKFYVSMFKLTSGVDNGPIFMTTKYELSIFDNIRYSYYKVIFICYQMIIELIKKLENGEEICFEEQNVEAMYFPQRLPIDGQIDWTRTSMEIYNFVRAQTRPYPGAFTLLNNQIVKIWEVVPFDINFAIFEPGYVVKKFINGELLVKTGDSFLIVKDYTASFIINEGDIFESTNFRQQMKQIIKRHYQKYPEFKINEKIENLAK